MYDSNNQLTFSFVSYFICLHCFQCLLINVCSSVYAHTLSKTIPTESYCYVKINFGGGFLNNIQMRSKPKVKK